MLRFVSFAHIVKNLFLGGMGWEAFYIISPRIPATQARLSTHCLKKENKDA